jgi:hypothetical protein
MNTYPFTLFKRSNRPFYFVSFKDANGIPLNPITTKKTTEKEAMQVAFEWLRDGIPKKKNVVKVQELAMSEMLRKLKDGSEVEKVMAELQRSGWVKSYVQKDTFAAVDFISYLKTFWDWETPPYITEKRRQKDSIHKRHCSNQYGALTFIGRAFSKGVIWGILPMTILTLL